MRNAIQGNDLKVTLNVLDHVKHELPTLTVDSTEHPVLTGCSAHIDV